MNIVRTSAITLVAATLASGVGAISATANADAGGRTVRASGPSYVHDVAFEGVRADVHAVTARGTTRVALRLRNLPAAVRGTTLGAHVHTGACGASAGASGPHYVNPAAPATTPIHDREIWLDADVNAAGAARATAKAAWVIAPGAARSVVVHANPTNHADGTAGARLFCIDVPFGARA